MSKIQRVLFPVMVGSLLALAGCLFEQLPIAQFTATPPFDYPPLLVSFDGRASSSPNGPIVAYAWDFGDGETAAGSIVTHTYAEKGVYTVTLEVTDGSGKKGVRTRTVEALNRAPVARFEASVYATGVNQPVWFDASASSDPDGTIVDYIWSFGDGTTGDGVLVSHEYTTAGGSGWKPQITLIVVDDDGASSSISHEILVVGCDSCGG
ncbi:MAG: PKD domain-containing protein [Candidatus Bipolaricaulota bacterium]